MTYNGKIEETGIEDRLEIALNAKKMKNVFEPVVRQHFGENLQINGLDIHVIQRRNKRAVLRYLIHAVDEQSAEEFQWGIIGKVYINGSGEQTIHNMKQLWKNGFSRNTGDGISIPEPLKFVSQLHLLLQEEIPGLPLRTLLKQVTEKEYFVKLARALTKLHRCPVVPTEPFTIENHLLRCFPGHELLSRICPDLAPRVEYIVEKAFQIEKMFGDIQCTAIHGDFHPGQAHFENGRLWLIDFDALSYGDPAADLGILLVFLKDKARKNQGMYGCILTFLKEYFSVMDPNIAERIPLYEGLTYLRRACECLRVQNEGWFSKATRMIDSGVVVINKLEKKFRKHKS